MGSHETSREPCPDRILDDLGGAFAMGAIGGSIYHFARGAINSPRGERFFGGMQTMRMSAPRTGGGFAAWGGMFSVFDCGMVYVRQREDPWNSILAGAAAGGLLQVRQGVKAAARSAVVGGILLGLIEGAGIMFNRVVSPPSGMVGFDDQGVVEAPAGGPGYPVYGIPGQQKDGVGGEVKQGGGGWLGGLFEKKEERSSGSGSESKTKVLECFDTPTPMSSFDYK